MVAKNKHIFISLLFLFIQILVILRNFEETFRNFFWFCDFAPLLLSFGFYYKHTDFIKGVVHIGLIPQSLFVIGLFLGWLTGIELISSISLTGYSVLYAIVSIVIHTATLLALIFTKKEGPKRKSLLYSLLILTGMYLITVLFTPTHDEFNYVFSHASLTEINIPYYVQLWIPIVFVVVVLPTYFIEKIIFELSKRQNITPAHN